ncbi:hypothetical protein SO802_011575 [Lithocarpus litseifolius]|uniref:F-box associated beta-propeller type 1 domain-containing protein n=1 Tax=Lithocarpus litseifolius TaxID=425828 RepID=A0AAW2D322_9ROSI
MLILIKQYACSVYMQEITGVGRVAELHRMDVFACINGIICVGGYFYSGFSGFFLWNPAISESKAVLYPKLPKSPVNLAIKPSPANPIARYAFGHDHNSNDYKVLRMVNYKGASERNKQSRNLVHVYSLSTDSWRQITNTPIDHSNIIIPDFLKFAYLNGVHHWYGSIFVTDDGRNQKFTKQAWTTSLNCSSSRFLHQSAPQALSHSFSESALRLPQQSTAQCSPAVHFRNNNSKHLAATANTNPEPIRLDRKANTNPEPVRSKRSNRRARARGLGAARPGLALAA